MIRNLLAILMIPMLAAGVSADTGVRIEESDPNLRALEGGSIPQFKVEAETYSAVVYENGRVQIFQGETVLLDGLTLDFGGDAEPLAGGVTRTGNTLRLHVGEARKTAADDIMDIDALLDDGPTIGDRSDHPLEDALPDRGGLDLTFHPDRIELTMAGLAPSRPRRGGEESAPQFELTGGFGTDAVGVVNLRNGVPDALPTRRIASPHRFSFGGQIGHYWPDVEITHASGTRMRIEGIDGVSHHDANRAADRLRAEPRGHWRLRNATADSRVTLTVSPAAEQAVAAAPYLTITPDKPRGLFYADEPVTYHLEMHPDYTVDGDWRAEWSLNDHRGEQISTGFQDLKIADGRITPPSVTIDLEQMGYAHGRLEIYRRDVPSARRSFSLEIARIRPENPGLRELDGGGHGEVLWANILGMRGVREVLSWSDIIKQAHNPDGSYDWDKALSRYRELIELSNGATARTWTSFLGAESWPKELNVTEEVELPEMGAAPLGTRTGGGDDLGLTLEEPEPAPQPAPRGRRDRAPAGPQPPPAEVREKETARYLSELAREAAKLGVTVWEPINEPDLVMSQQRYLDNILKPQYPAVKAGNPNANFLGGSLCGLEKYTWLRKLYELGGHEYFDDVSMHPYTAVGFQEVYRSQLQEYFDLFAEYGKPETKLWLTESASHRGWGYNDYVYDRYNAWRESHARNAVNMILNAEAMGVPRSQIAVFYYTEHGYNDFYLVRRRSLTSAAVSLQVMNENLRDAAFEQELPLATPGHHLQIYRDTERTVAVAFTADEPAELTLLTGATEVRISDMMGNQRKIQPIDGRFTLTISGDPTYLHVAAGDDIQPDYSRLTVQPNLALTTLGATASASASDPATPPQGAIAGDWTAYSLGRRHGWKEPEDAKDQWPDWYEVQLAEPASVNRVRLFHDFGAWERTLRDYEVQVFTDGDWKTVDHVENNRWRHVYDHRFDPVMTDRVRVRITNVNSSLFEQINWIRKVSNLRAMEVYAEPAASARAFFVQELPKRRRMEAGESTPLTFRVRNTQADELSAEVRLILPEGVTADTAAQPITIGPDGEAECSFTVTLNGVQGGALTVLAGLYQGDQLISTDHSPRVLTAEKAETIEKPHQTPPPADTEGPRDALDVMNQAQPDADEP